MYIIFSSSSKAKFKTKNSRDCKVQTYLVKKVQNRYVKMNKQQQMNVFAQHNSLFTGSLVNLKHGHFHLYSSTAKTPHALCIQEHLL